MSAVSKRYADGTFLKKATVCKFRKAMLKFGKPKCKMGGLSNYRLKMR